MATTRTKTDSASKESFSVADPQEIITSLIQKKNTIAQSNLSKSLKSKLANWIDDVIKLNKKTPESVVSIHLIEREILQLSGEINSIDKKANIESPEVDVILMRFCKDFSLMRNKKDGGAAINLSFNDYPEYYREFKDYGVYCNLLEQNSQRLQELDKAIKDLQSKKTTPKYFSTLLKQAEKLEKKLNSITEEKINSTDMLMDIIGLKLKLAVCIDTYKYFTCQDALKDSRSIAQTSIKLSEGLLGILAPIVANFQLITASRDNILKQNPSLLSSSQSTMFGKNGGKQANKKRDSDLVTPSPSRKK